MTPFTRVTFRDDAMEDVRRLAERSQPVLLEVFRLLKALDDGSLMPAALHDYAKTGDLPYLLAGLRVGRREDPVRRSDAQRRVARIQQLRDR